MTYHDKLKFTFIFGAVVDAVIALTWLLIAMGQGIPNIMSGYTGHGADYEFAMYIAAMFMFGWAVILAWGARNPQDRKGLLPITALFLLLSVIIELTIYLDELAGPAFVFGIMKRCFLISLFTYVYFTSPTSGEIHVNQS